MDKYKVYLYKNKINGKIYVGQTKRTLKKRANGNGSGYKKSTKFEEAILEYGWDNFEPHILYDGLTKEEADDIEMRVISLFDTTNPEFGYNTAEGGRNCGNPETKIPVVKLDMDFNLIDRYNSICEASQHNEILSPSGISRVCKHQYLQCHGFIWMFEDDYKNDNFDKEEIKYRFAHYGESPWAKKVVKCDINMNFICEYDNIMKASKKNNCNRTGINDNCSHRLKTSNGYIWMYSEEYYKLSESEKEAISKEVSTINHEKHAVIQYDKDMHFINEYPSILEAYKATGVGRKEIAQVCKGNAKTAKGFIWRYK